MKRKLLLLLTAVLLLLTLAGSALAAKAGETVTVPIRLNNSNGCYVKVRISYDSSVLTLESLTCSAGYASGTTMVMADTSPIASGQIGTATFRIKDNAQPGTYTVGASVVECWDINENPGSASASGGSVIVTACQHAQTTWSTVKEATCAADGQREERCNECGTIIKRETIAASTIPHTPGEMTQTKAPGCTAEGEKSQKCTVCQKIIKTEVIPATGHDNGTWKTTKEPACTVKGEKSLICGKCAATIKSEEIPATGHDDGTWKTTKEPACTVKGEKSLICGKCAETIKSEEIPATGHDKGTWVVASPATCEKDGVEELRCTKCAAVLDSRVLPAAGIAHTPGKMTQTTDPTCEQDGEKTQLCTVCGAVIAREPVPATGHKPGKMVVTLQPTCTEKGEQTQTCTTCGVVIKTEPVDATGHDQGRWHVTVEPTRETEGMRERRCKACGYVLETEVLPIVTAIYYDMTACSVGPRFRDLGVNTDKWFMFTPVDLSVDGEYEFDLIAGNIHKVGTVTVLVNDGTVTVSYEVISGVKVDNEFLSILHDLEEAELLETDEMIQYAFGQPISIQNELDGDPIVLIFLCNELHYSSEIRQLTHFREAGADYQALLERCEQLMALDEY